MAALAMSSAAAFAQDVQSDGSRTLNTIPHSPNTGTGPSPNVQRALTPGQFNNAWTAYVNRQMGSIPETP